MLFNVSLIEMAMVIYSDMSFFYKCFSQLIPLMIYIIIYVKTPQEKRHTSQIFIKDMCLFSCGVFIYIYIYIMQIYLAQVS